MVTLQVYPHVITLLAERIHADFGISVHLCGEIEVAFAYATDAPDAFWQALLHAAQAEGIALESIGRERTGRDDIQQYECRFQHGDPLAAAQAINWLNVQLNKLAKIHNIKLLDIKTSCDESIYNGLHWHLHLLNEAGDYLFLKQDEQLSPPLSDALGGLLVTMPALMPCFAPSDSSYKRLASGADHVPTTVSWGGNNRTTALRLPESVIPLRHIEHRVCGADADPFAAVWALLVGLHYGLTHHPEPGAQCFGDANLPGAPFAKLPMTLENAQAAQEEAAWLKNYPQN